MSALQVLGKFNLKILPAIGKGGLRLLLLTEFGFAFMGKKALDDTWKIVYTLTNSNEVIIAKVSNYVNWPLAGMLCVGTILSTGDINKSLGLLSKLRFSTRGEKIQLAAFGVTYLTGSLGAPAALWTVTGFNIWSVPIGIILYAQQVLLFTLQTNSRIESSVADMCFIAKNMCINTVLSKEFVLAVLMTMFDTIYRALTFFYMAATSAELFTESKWIIWMLGSFFAVSSGYFTFATQGVDQLFAAIQKHINSELVEEEDPPRSHEPQCSKPNIATFFILAVMTYRIITGVSFGYSVIHGGTYDKEDFSQRDALLSLIFLLPAASSGAQFVLYSQNQARDAMTSFTSKLRSIFSPLCNFIANVFAAKSNRAETESPNHDSAPFCPSFADAEAPLELGGDEPAIRPSVTTPPL